MHRGWKSKPAVRERERDFRHANQAMKDRLLTRMLSMIGRCPHEKLTPEQSSHYVIVWGRFDLGGGRNGIYKTLVPYFVEKVDRSD